jgi:hypothetical protein
VTPSANSSMRAVIADDTSASTPLAEPFALSV